ncbi:MAG: hypothetical protein WAK82_26560, partial [Streptosporangiaceae bacterium]
MNSIRRADGSRSPNRRGLIAMPLPGRLRADYFFWTAPDGLPLLVPGCEQGAAPYWPGDPAVRFCEAACAASSVRVV